MNIELKLFNNLIKKKNLFKQVNNNVKFLIIKIKSEYFKM